METTKAWQLQPAEIRPAPNPNNSRLVTGKRKSWQKDAP